MMRSENDQKSGIRLMAYGLRLTESNIPPYTVCHKYYAEYLGSYSFLAPGEPGILT